MKKADIFYTEFLEERYDELDPLWGNPLADPSVDYKDPNYLKQWTTVNEFKKIDKIRKQLPRLRSQKKRESVVNKIFEFNQKEWEFLEYELSKEDIKRVIEQLKEITRIVKKKNYETLSEEEKLKLLPPLPPYIIKTSGYKDPIKKRQEDLINWLALEAQCKYERLRMDRGDVSVLYYLVEKQYSRRIWKELNFAILKNYHQAAHDRAWLKEKTNELFPVAKLIVMRLIRGETLESIEYFLYNRRSTLERHLCLNTKRIKNIHEKLRVRSETLDKNSIEYKILNHSHYGIFPFGFPDSKSTVDKKSWRMKVPKYKACDIKDILAKNKIIKKQFDKLLAIANAADANLSKKIESWEIRKEVTEKLGKLIKKKDLNRGEIFLKHLRRQHYLLHIPRGVPPENAVYYSFVPSQSTSLTGYLFGQKGIVKQQLREFVRRKAAGLKEPLTVSLDEEFPGGSGKYKEKIAAQQKSKSASEIEDALKQKGLGEKDIKIVLLRLKNLNQSEIANELGYKDRSIISKRLKIIYQKIPGLSEGLPKYVR